MSAHHSLLISAFPSTATTSAHHNPVCIFPDGNQLHTTTCTPPPCLPCRALAPTTPPALPVPAATRAGPYTIILPASKHLPSQCVDFLKAKTMTRKSVGVRMPEDKVCRELLESLDHPLLCTSAHVPEALSPDTETPDLGSMLTAYAGEAGWCGRLAGCAGV